MFATVCGLFSIPRLEIILWDPCAKSKLCLSAASMPIAACDLDSKMVIQCLDRFMEAAHGYVKGVIFDAATPHQIVRRFFFGVPTAEDKRIATTLGLKFFAKLAYHPLPDNSLPRLPIQLVTYGGEAHFAFPGVCHAAKNTGSQVQSVLRTVHLGQFWVDLTGARGQGLPPPAFSRDDSQSDAIQALLSNPFFYVPSPQGQLDTIPVLWSTRGALLWSVSTALCTSPVLHRKMTLQERCETAVAGYVLWDLWQLLAAKTEAAQELAAGSCSMAQETVTNLQNVALSVIAFTVAKSVT